MIRVLEASVVAALCVVAAGVWVALFAAIANALIVQPVPALIARAAGAEAAEMECFVDPESTVAFATGAAKVGFYRVRRHEALTSLPEAWLLRDRIPAGSGR